MIFSFGFFVRLRFVMGFQQVEAVQHHFQCSLPTKHNVPALKICPRFLKIKPFQVDERAAKSDGLNMRKKQISTNSLAHLINAYFTVAANADAQVMHRCVRKLIKIKINNFIYKNHLNPPFTPINEWGQQRRAVQPHLTNCGTSSLHG